MEMDKKFSPDWIWERSFIDFNHDGLCTVQFRIVLSGVHKYNKKKLVFSAYYPFSLKFRSRLNVSLCEEEEYFIA